jgi:hypothetical protein
MLMAILWRNSYKMNILAQAYDNIDDYVTFYLDLCACLQIF